jgi:hypothetical protein
MSGTEPIFPDAKFINVSGQEQRTRKRIRTESCQYLELVLHIGSFCVRFRLLPCLLLSRILPQDWNLKQGARVSYELLAMNAKSTLS